MFEGNPQDPATKSDLHLVKSDLQTVKSDLQSMKSELTSDLQSMKSELKSDMQSLEASVQTKLDMLQSEMHHIADDLKEVVRDSQTEVLKAFYSFAQSNSKRVVELEGNEAALRGRLGIIEDRLLEVEKRLNIPLVN